MGFNVDEGKAGREHGNAVEGSGSQTPEDGGLSVTEEGYARKASSKIRTASKTKGRLSNGVSCEDCGPPKARERSLSQPRSNGTLTCVGESSRRGRRGGGGPAGHRGSLSSPEDEGADGAEQEEKAEGNAGEPKQEGQAASQPRASPITTTSSSAASLRLRSQDRGEEQADSDSAFRSGSSKGEKRKAESASAASSETAVSASMPSGTEEVSGRRYAFREKRQKRERFEADISAKKSYTAVPTGYSLSSSDLAPEQVRGLQLFVYRRKSRPYRRRRGDGVLDTSRQEAGPGTGGSSQLALTPTGTGDSSPVRTEEKPSSAAFLGDRPTEEGSEDREEEAGKVSPGGPRETGPSEGQVASAPQTSYFRKRQQGKSFRYEKNGYFRSNEGSASQRGGRGGGFKAAAAGGGRLSMAWRGEGPGGGRAAGPVEGRKKTGLSKSPSFAGGEAFGTGGVKKGAFVGGLGVKKEERSVVAQGNGDEEDDAVTIPEDIAQVLKEQFQSEPQAVDEFVPFGLYYDDALVANGELLERQVTLQRDRYLSAKAAFQEEMCRRLSLRPKRERDGLKSEASPASSEFGEPTSRIAQTDAELRGSGAAAGGERDRAREFQVKRWKSSDNAPGEEEQIPQSSEKTKSRCVPRETLLVVKKEETTDGGAVSTDPPVCPKMTNHRVMGEEDVHSQSSDVIERASLSSIPSRDTVPQGADGEKEKAGGLPSFSSRCRPPRSQKVTEGEGGSSQREPVAVLKYKRSDSGGRISAPGAAVSHATASCSPRTRGGDLPEEPHADEEKRHRKVEERGSLEKHEPPLDDKPGLLSQPFAGSDCSPHSQREMKRNTDTPDATESALSSVSTSPSRFPSGGEQLRDGSLSRERACGLGDRDRKRVSLGEAEEANPNGESRETRTDRLEAAAASSSSSGDAVVLEGKKKDSETKGKIKQEEGEEQEEGLLLFPENAWTAEGALEEVLKRGRWERDDEEDLCREATKRLRSSAASLLKAAARLMADERPFQTQLAAASLAAAPASFLGGQVERGRALSMDGGAAVRAHRREEKGKGKDTEGSSDTGRECVASVASSASTFSVRRSARHGDGVDRFCSVVGRSSLGRFSATVGKTGVGIVPGGKPIHGGRGKAELRSSPGTLASSEAMRDIMHSPQEKKNLFSCRGRSPRASSPFLSLLAKRRHLLTLYGCSVSSTSPSSRHSSSSCPLPGSPCSPTSSSAVSSLSCFAPSGGVPSSLFSVVRAQARSLQPVLKTASSSLTSSLLSLSPFAVLQGIPALTVLSLSSFVLLEKEFQTQGKTEQGRRKAEDVREEREAATGGQEKTKEEEPVDSLREKMPNEEVPGSVRWSAAACDSAAVPLASGQPAKQPKEEAQVGGTGSGDFAERGGKAALVKGLKALPELSDRTDAPSSLRSRTLREASRNSEDSGRGSSVNSVSASRPSPEGSSFPNSTKLRFVVPFKTRGRKRKSFPKHIFFDSRTFSHSALSCFTQRAVQGVGWPGSVPVCGSGPRPFRSWRRLRAILRAACVNRLARLKVETDQRQEAFYIPPSDDWEALGTVLRFLPSSSVEAGGDSGGGRRKVGEGRLEGILFSSSSSEDEEAVEDCYYHTLAPLLSSAESEEEETGRSSPEGAGQLARVAGGERSIHDLLAAVQPVSNQTPTILNTESPCESPASAPALASSISPCVSSGRPPSSAASPGSGPGLCPPLSSYAVGMQSPGLPTAGPHHQSFLLSRAILRLRQEEKRLLTPPPLPLKRHCLSADFQQIAHALWEGHQGCFVVPNREKHWRIIDGALEAHSDKLPKGGEAKADCASYREERYPDHLPFSAAQLDRFHFFPSEKQEFERRRKAQAAAQAASAAPAAAQSSQNSPSPSSASPSSSSSPATPLHLARAPTPSSRSSASSSTWCPGVSSSSKGGMTSNVGSGPGAGSAPGHPNKVQKTTPPASAGARGGTEKGGEGCSRGAACSFGVPPRDGGPLACDGPCSSRAGPGGCPRANEVEASGAEQRQVKTPQQSQLRCYQSNPQCASYHKRSMATSNGKTPAASKRLDGAGAMVACSGSSDGCNLSCPSGTAGGGPGDERFAAGSSMGGHPPSGCGEGGLSCAPASVFETHGGSSGGGAASGGSSRGLSPPAGSSGAEGASGGGLLRSSVSSSPSTAGGGPTGGASSTSLQRLQRDAASNPEVESDIQQLLLWRWRKEGGPGLPGTATTASGGGGGAGGGGQGLVVEGSGGDGGGDGSMSVPSGCVVEGRASAGEEKAEEEEEEAEGGFRRRTPGSGWGKRVLEKEDPTGRKEGRSDGEGGQLRAAGRQGRGAGGASAAAVEQEEAEVEETRTNSSVATTTASRSTFSSAVATSECGGSGGPGGEFLSEVGGGGESACGRPRRNAAGHRLADVLGVVKGLGDRGGEKVASQGAPVSIPVAQTVGHTYQSFSGLSSPDSPSSSSLHGKNPSLFASPPYPSQPSTHVSSACSSDNNLTSSTSSQTAATDAPGEGCAVPTTTGGMASLSAAGGVLAAGPPPLKCLLRLLRAYPLSVVAQRLGVHRSTVARWVKVWPKQQEGLEDDVEADVEGMSQDDL